DTEAEILRKSENAFRNHSIDEQKAAMHELVQLMAKQISQEEPAEEEEAPEAGKRKGKRGAGRRKTPVGKARERLAEQRGLQPEAIRMAEWRARERQEAKLRGISVKDLREERKRLTEPLEATLIPPVLTLDMELEQDFAVAMANIQRRVDDIASRASVALLLLTSVSNSALPIRQERAVRAREALQT